MTFQTLKREHPGKICICRPHLRDAGSGKVVSWICLRTFDRVDEAKEALKSFEQNGVTDAVFISTNRQISIEGDLAARYYRVYLGSEQ
ncbi:MAG: hypothetical protein HFJ96_05990 [Peptococcaceae bacterium]|jgi:hypothetical protein|nr:hypothetical protein [Peptococcaceae bacterium]